MTVTSHSRGHEIVLIESGWVYVDDGSPHDDSRPCKRCGRYPTEEGCDACLGFIEGVQSACCGHGEEKPYYITVPIGSS